MDDLNISVDALALAGLHEFHDEQKKILNFKSNTEVTEVLLENNLSKFFPEDWQISQFWYDNLTSEILTKEVARILKEDQDSTIAFISCPSIFRTTATPDNKKKVHLFEFDRRFDVFGENFHFYDYNFPESIPEFCSEYFSTILLDPPFLSEECLKKMAITVNKISKPNAKIILCTGDLLEGVAKECLNLTKSNFIPSHIPTTVKLRSTFGCFTNYNFKI